MSAATGTLLVMFLVQGAAQSGSAPPSQACVDASRIVETQAARGVPEPQALAGLLQVYQRALNGCPNHPEALNHLADTLERLGRLDESIAAYGRAAQARPGWALPLFGLGDAQRKAGRHGEALYWYRKGLELEPTDAETLARVRELAPDDPEGLIGSRSILESLETTRGSGVIRPVAPVAFNERLIPFEFGSAVLKPAARSQIREIAFAFFDLLGASRSMGVLAAGPPIAEIVGHTDGRGTDAYNMSLGLRRAQAVLDALVTEYRVPPTRVVARSMGRSVLKCGEQTDACHAQNRRVEIRRPQP